LNSLWLQISILKFGGVNTRVLFLLLSQKLTLGCSGKGFIERGYGCEFESWIPQLARIYHEKMKMFLKIWCGCLVWASHDNFLPIFLATFAISEKSFTRKPHGNSLKKTANVNIYNGSS
jgi:hypothetical protein